MKQYCNMQQRIMKFRTDNNVSLSDLALACGVSRQAVWLWENGRTNPSIPTLLKLFKTEDQKYRDLAQECLSMLAPEIIYPMQSKS